MFPYRIAVPGRRTTSLLSLLALVALVVAVPTIYGDEPVTLAAAEIFIEVNDTDGDAGVQVFLDGEGWEMIRIFSPSRRHIFQVRARGSAGVIGITELFFESAEPSFEELPLANLLEMFPEGDYRFFGRTAEGARLTGVATLTHALPAGPVTISPKDGSEQDPDDTVISWEPVTEPAGIEIISYQVVVLREDPLRTFSVDLPASVTSISVPAEFLEPETAYKYEVLAVEASGNKTITEVEFETE